MLISGWMFGREKYDVKKCIKNNLYNKTFFKILNLFFDEIQLNGKTFITSCSHKHKKQVKIQHVYIRII